MNFFVVQSGLRVCLVSLTSLSCLVDALYFFAIGRWVLVLFWLAVGYFVFGCL